MEDPIEKKDPAPEIEISDDDIYEAMKDIQGYLDITPADLKDIYRLAYRHSYNRITMSVRARDIMTRELIAVRKTTLLEEVADVMASRGVSGVPVLDDDGRIAGVISGKDFLESMGAKDKNNFMAVVAECLKGQGCAEIPLRGKKAEDIMRSPAITIGEEATVMEIAAIFSSKKINRVPVTDKDGAIVGIVSRADIVRASTIGARA